MPKHSMMRWTWAALAALTGTGAMAAGATGFTPMPCPASVAPVATCHAARDANGAWLLAAVPHEWNRRLVVHAHGGPRLTPPRENDSADDLDRFAPMVRAGYAWIGSTYRRGGYGVRSAAEDVEASRDMFWATWGRPKRTLLHGQSWGGNVAAKTAELHALDSDGRARYDGVLVTNGVLSGGTRAYDFRADLRAVYQFYCGNHPAPDEPAYPLWQGLPADSAMTRDDLARRVDDCTGVSLAPDARSAGQASKLRDIVAASGIAETELVSHLAWGTFHFRDLVQKRLQGRNPFDNTQRAYRGSRDDASLNAGIERFAADPAALAMLAYDADLSGLIVVPLLSIHAQKDPVVSIAGEAMYADTVRHAGRSHLLAQFTTDESDHSRLREESTMTALAMLEGWIDSGHKPDFTHAAAWCRAHFENKGSCLLLP